MTKISSKQTIRRHAQLVHMSELHYIPYKKFFLNMLLPIRERVRLGNVPTGYNQ